MRKYRRLYIGILILFLAAWFWVGNAFLLAVFLVLAALPWVLRLLLRAETKGIRFEQELRPSCESGSELTLKIRVNGKRAFLAAGRIEIRLRIENRLLGEQREKCLYLAPPGKEDTYLLSLDTSLCGELHIVWERAVCFDLFGLFSVLLEAGSERICTVFPKTIPLKVERSKTSSGYRYGEGLRQMKKGNDASEILDLREYRLGDDIRSIHWKLSGKLAKTIVREASEPAHFYTMLLFDAGIKISEKTCSKQMLSAAVELCISLSRELFRMDISHCVGIPVEGKLYTMEGKTGYPKVTEQLLGIPLQKQQGMGLMQFLIQQMEWNYAKLIYVTAGDYPGELEQIDSGIDVTAICIREDGDRVSVARAGAAQLLQIPVQVLYENTHRITI